MLKRTLNAPASIGSKVLLIACLVIGSGKAGTLSTSANDKFVEVTYSPANKAGTATCRAKYPADGNY